MSTEYCHPNIARKVKIKEVKILKKKKLKTTNMELKC